LETSIGWQALLGLGLTRTPSHTQPLSPGFINREHGRLCTNKYGAALLFFDISLAAASTTPLRQPTPRCGGKGVPSNAALRRLPAETDT